jgi:hypothetical protein
VHVSPRNSIRPKRPAQALIEAAKSDGERRVAQGARQGWQAARGFRATKSPTRTHGRSSSRITPPANSLDKSEPDFVKLEVGEDKWPFPVPIISENGKWHFDTPTGVDELVNAASARTNSPPSSPASAYADAQREYYSRNPENSPLLHYAGRLISTEGKKDGLYWAVAENEDQSPLGEGFAKARAEGLSAKRRRDDEGRALSRLHLSAAHQARRQRARRCVRLPGQRRTAGRLRGNRVSAEYGISGVMTFMVNHDGVVYSKGPGSRHDETRHGDRQLRSGLGLEEGRADAQTAGVQ